MSNHTDRAERLDRARALSRRLSDAIWQVDSAESLLRKAQPSTGYRSSEKLSDAAWNVAEHEERVELAHTNLADVLMLLELGALHELPSFQAKLREHYEPTYVNGYEARAAAGKLLPGECHPDDWRGD